MLRVLQIANGYFQSDLYARMFEKMNHVGIVSEVYVPLANGSELPVGVSENIHISRNYSQLDRILFFKKQKHLIHDLLPYIKQDDVIHAHTLFLPVMRRGNCISSTVFLILWRCETPM